jgi:hypothetical protein
MNLRNFLEYLREEWPGLIYSSIVFILVSFIICCFYEMLRKINV